MTGAVQEPVLGSPQFGGQASEVLPVVRAKVRDLLRRSQAFQSLPPEKQRDLAHDMVTVARYIAAGETGDNVPAAAAFARPASQDFQAEAARQGGAALTEVIREVNFPQFVAGLIDGVFNAIVDASIKQMEAYSELVKNVAKSVDQYMKDNVSENQARDHLVERYPDHLELDLEAEQPQVRPKSDADQDSLPDFFADLGLSAPLDTLDEESTEQVLVPAARRRLAMDRQQLLATMVMMGINRLIVTNGNISASVLFRLDTRDMLARHMKQTAEFSKTTFRKTRPGFWSWFRPSTTAETSVARLNVTTTQSEDSEAETKMKVELKGNVNVNFRSETFPLDRMVDVLVLDKIQEKTPGRRPQAGQQPAGAVQPATAPAA